MGKMSGEFAPDSPRSGQPAPPPPGPGPSAPPLPPPPALPQAGAGAGGGTYRLHPDEMQGLIDDWQKVMDKLDAMNESAQGMLQVGPPAKEHASDAMNAATLRSVQAYLAHNQQMKDYATAQHQHLIDALNAYTAHDQQSADVFKQQQA